MADERKWIRMSECLPEMGETVQFLVINDENGGHEYDTPEIYVGYPAIDEDDNSGEIHWYIPNLEYQPIEISDTWAVTHWRPLPDFPPEDEWRQEYKIQSELWDKTHPDADEIF